MFPWNIAKSAEKVFSRWAVRRVCKFLLKKKLGQFILGDIDLDQLDVQLSAGTIQLSDLALNVDYLNQKFGAGVTVLIKEGSIGSLLVKLPWNGEGFQIEVDELELLLVPCTDYNSSSISEPCSSRDGISFTRSEPRNIKHETLDSAATSTVHEGVKTIARMLKLFLTSFHVKIKKLIVAVDPCLDKDEKEAAQRSILVLRMSEAECGTNVSDNASRDRCRGVESILGMSPLTNFIKFQGAIIELLQMDNLDKQQLLPCASETTIDEWVSGCHSCNATTPIMTGERDGFSGKMKLSIPWENGSLDIRKVAADIHMDPIKLTFQPSTLKWLLLSWDSWKNLNKDGRTHLLNEATNRVYFNSAPHMQLSASSSCSISRDEVAPVSPTHESPNTGFCSTIGRESVTDGLLLGSHLISDWVPFPANDKEDKEVDFAASVDHFFECFDGVRNSQSALGSSGIWNWTCSVFSAITVASNLASGSLHLPPVQQHVETNLSATFSGISVVFSFSDCGQRHLCDLEDYKMHARPYDDCLVAEGTGLFLHLRVCPQAMKFEATMEHLELVHHLRSDHDACGHGLHVRDDDLPSWTHLVQDMQAEVEGALPPFALSTRDYDLGKASQLLAAGKGDEFKVMLLKTSGICHCEIILESSSVDDSLEGSASFSLKMPSLVFWVNFHVLTMLLDLLKEIGDSAEMNSAGNGFAPEAFKEKHKSLDRGVRSSSQPWIRAQPSKISLQGNMFLPNARIVFCFPFGHGQEYHGYTSWDKFISLDFTLPLAQDSTLTPGANSHKKYSATATRSMCVTFGKLDIHLITSACKDHVSEDSYGMRRQKFCAERIFSVRCRTNCLSVISMFWKEGRVTGCWTTKKAKILANTLNSRVRTNSDGKGYEFASVNTLKDLDELSSFARQEIISSSALVFRITLLPVIVDLDISQYLTLYNLLYQVMKEFVHADEQGCAKEEIYVPQTSIFVECDSIEISIIPGTIKDISVSLQSELPGSWQKLKLEIQKFDLLSVSNIGGIRNANFFWMVHGVGELRGSVTGTPDQDFLLLSCSNSTIQRGDGEGSNALSARGAGSDVMYIWDPEDLNCFTSISIRCVTFCGVGGRLDWLEAILSFFSLPSSVIAETIGADLRKGETKTYFSSSFAINLVDVGLSYEPYLKDLLVNDEAYDSELGCSATATEETAQSFGCLLAASSLSLSNTPLADSISSDYDIRVQDLGLLLHPVSEFGNVRGTYSVENLHKLGYVKVAKEAVVEAVLRINCGNDLLWEVECSALHIDLETCHDSTSGLIRLGAQLQQLFSPNVEESIVHLQKKWNTFQQNHEYNNCIGEREIFNNEITTSTNTIGNSQSETGVSGLMEEVWDDAFHPDETLTFSQEDYCGSQPYISSNGSSNEKSINLGYLGFFNENSSLCETSIIEAECSDTSNLKKLCFPQHIEEGYLFVGNQSLNDKFNCKFSDMGNGDLGRETSGWYQDTSLRILENHILDGSEGTGDKKFLQRTASNRIGVEKMKGRFLLRNVNIRWKMYAGSDWCNFRNHNKYSGNVCNRDSAIFLELSLSGMDCLYDIFHDGEVLGSLLSLTVEDFHFYDNRRDAPWKLILGYYHSKDHPRKSSSKAFKLEIRAVRPDPLTSLEEYRLRVAVLPTLLHLHQNQLDFLISFFGGEILSVHQVPGLDGGGSKPSSVRRSDFVGRDIPEEALLPYFQTFEIFPVIVRVDYTPNHIDLVALGCGKYAELVNLVPWKGIELQLKHVNAIGVYGWGSVCETVVGEWLEDISQNQVHKLLQGLPTIRSLVSVGSGAAKLVSLPVEGYKKEKKLVKGMQRGTIAFLRSISLEAVGLGVHLAAGAHDILLQAEYTLSISSTEGEAAPSRMEMSARSNQPENSLQGIQQAYGSLSDGLGKSASVLFQTPFKKYNRGAGAGSALASVVRAAPAAAIAPASAAARAVHCALLGVRNSLDPQHKNESMEKYLGPLQQRKNT